MIPKRNLGRLPDAILLGGRASNRSRVSITDGRYQ